MRGVVTTGPLPEAGPLTDWRLAFSTADRKAIAVIGLGSDAPEGAKLRVAWYRVDGPGKRTHLFTHRLKVRAGGGLVLSHGVAEQGLAPGNYEIVATLGRPPGARPLGGAHRRRAGRRLGPQGLLGVEHAGVDLGGLGGPDARRTRVVRAGGRRPSRPGPRPCTVDSINGSMSPMTDVRASAWFLGQCSVRTLTAAVTGAPVTLASSTETDGPLSSLHGRGRYLHGPRGGQ